MGAYTDTYSDTYVADVSPPPPPPPPPPPVPGLAVELYLGTLGWVDITSYVYYRDSSSFINITRGRPNEAGNAQPQTASFELNNRDGRFSPRNPVGAYYGYIGRNTQVRISRPFNSVRYYRFHGEIPEWPTNADISASDIYIPITAYGQLRRLSQGTPPSLSAMFRAYTKTNSATNVVAYWPCEDGTGATALASGLSGHTPMQFTGSPTLASSTSFQCSTPLPTFNGSVWTGTISPPVAWTDNVLRFLMAIPSGGDTDNGIIARFFTTGTVARADLKYNTAFGGELTILGYDGFGGTLFTLGPYTAPTGTWDGGLYRFGFALRQQGSLVQYSFQAIPTSGSFTGSASGTISGTVGAVNQVIMNPNGNMVGTAMGHISVQLVWNTLNDLRAPLQVFNTDSTDRLVRLCGEENVPVQVLDGAATSDPRAYGTGFDPPCCMGAQLPGTFPALLQQCMDVDAGILFETRDRAGLAWRPRFSLYNQGTAYSTGSAPVVTLDYASHQLSSSPVPQDDDYYTRNDITVQQIGGTSARQFVDVGPLSVQPPPNGVGEYNNSFSLNINSDAFLGPGQMTIADHAGWRLHLGTIDEPRYPSLSVNLRSSHLSTSLIQALLAAEIGDVLQVTNPPAWLPPDAVRQIIQGYSERIGTFEHDIVFNCSPESAYRVAASDDTTLSVADTDASVLAAGVASGATTLSVATSTAGSPLWSTSSGDRPFDIVVGGERMTVTNVTGSSSPQTFTVTRSVNGVVKAQLNNADVRLYQPMVLSL